MNNCTGPYPTIYVCRYDTPGNVIGQHPLTDPSTQCPLNGGGRCSTTTGATATMGTSSFQTSSPQTTSPHTTQTTSFPPTMPPTYPPTCSPDPDVVHKIKPPQTKIRFLFEGMFDGLCDDTPVPDPCPTPCTGPITPGNSYYYDGSVSGLVL